MFLCFFSFWNRPAPDEREVLFYVERLLSCFESALKERLVSVKHIDFPVAIFRFLFLGKGEGLLRGVLSLQNGDFDPKFFPSDWHSVVINKRGTSRKILFPVTLRSFLAKSPPLFERRDDGIFAKKQRLIQRLSITVYKETENL